VNMEVAVKMRSVVAITILLASAGWSLAQEAPLIPQSAADYGQGTGGFSPPRNEGSSGPRFWGSGEYLLWWIKDAPAANILVSTGSVTDVAPGLLGFPTSGALGQPTTKVLFGDSTMDYGTISGMRATSGVWLDPDAMFGVEGSGFLLERRTVGFRAASDNTGSPILSLSFLNAVTGLESAAPLAAPGAFGTSIPQVGSIVITSNTRLWGAEANGVANLYKDEAFSVELLAGFRYADLSENLNDQVETSASGAVVVPFLVPGVGPFVATFPGTLDIKTYDQFSTRNQFYGAQLGGRARFHLSDLSVALSAKVAVGSTHEVVNINGFGTVASSGLFAGFGAGPLPGGQFALPTNIGRHTHDEFTVMPEAQAQVNYDLTRHVRAFAGYDFLYWSRVVRPGDQVDRDLNPTQVPGLGGGALVGPARPAPLFNQSSFWANGVSFGLGLSF
jgi:Putative beta barrel porin-7 (BBP7)